ncbi:MAG TPA: hypothetical protein PKO06_20235, partial [Candidatus Ozemobacteraceae bacterium]|nr:hypothetical protein [Candidatus Ozemobacteraceae bacterium]
MIRQVCLVFLFCLLIFYPAHGYAQALDEAAAAPAASASESTPAAPEPTSAPVAKGGGGWLQNWVTGSAEFVRVLEGILEQLARLFGIPVPFPAPQAEPGVPTADTGSSSPVAQPGTSDSGPTSGTTAPSDTSGVASSATGPITNPGVTSGGDGGTIAIPPRPADARGGRAFIESTNRMTRPQREQAVFDEISRGNVPEFVRTWKTIEATFTGRDGQTHTVRYRV